MSVLCAAVINSMTRDRPIPSRIKRNALAHAFRLEFLSQRKPPSRRSRRYLTPDTDQPRRVRWLVQPSRLRREFSPTLGRGRQGGRGGGVFPGPKLGIFLPLPPGILGFGVRIVFQLGSAPEPGTPSPALLLGAPAGFIRGVRRKLRRF